MEVPFVVSLCLAVGINWLVFVPAFWFQTDKLTDITYAVTFIAVAWWGAFHYGIQIPTVLVSLWAIRLGGFLAYRIQHKGRDKRFDTMRPHPLNFFGFWTLQGVSVFVILLPVICYFPVNEHFTATKLIPLFLWMLGFVIQAVADHQKFRFKSSHPNAFMDHGIFAYCQHPNYLGEILMWVAIYLFVIHDIGTYKYIAMLSPIWIFVLLRYISGIPLLRIAHHKKYGATEGFQTYQRNTPLFLTPAGWCIFIVLIIIYCQL